MTGAPGVAPAPPRIALFHEQAQAIRQQIEEQHPGLRLTLAPDPPALLTIASDVDIVITGRLPKGFVFPAETLRWIQSTSSGVDHLIPACADLPDLMITNGRGLHADNIADYVFCMLTSLLIGLPQILAERSSRIWNSRHVPALRDKTLCVIGHGPVGAEIARRGALLGMNVVTVTRSGRAAEDKPYPFRPVCDLIQTLSLSDFVVLATPATTETRSLVGASELAAMKRDAFLVNIARGSVVDEDALIHALTTGVIAGAALDVFQQEPLPPTSPFWDMPNVILTPHMSGNLANFSELVARLFVDNYRRFINGQALLNRVDPARGY